MNAKHQQRIDNAIAALVAAPLLSRDADLMHGYVTGVLDGLQAADAISGDELLASLAAIEKASAEKAAQEKAGLQ